LFERKTYTFAKTPENWGCLGWVGKSEIVEFCNSKSRRKDEYGSFT
jgi:hypothetical protein